MPREAHVPLAPPYFDPPRRIDRAMVLRGLRPIGKGQGRDRDKEKKREGRGTDKKELWARPHLPTSVHNISSVFQPCLGHLVNSFPWPLFFFPQRSLPPPTFLSFVSFSFGFWFKQSHFEFSYFSFFPFYYDGLFKRERESESVCEMAAIGPWKYGFPFHLVPPPQVKVANPRCCWR